MLYTDVPVGMSILRDRVACQVKDASIKNQYDLYPHTCADGSSMKENVD